jgi:hypothetical protein
MEIHARVEITNWCGSLAAGTAETLEAGNVLIAPDLNFELTPDERRFLSPRVPRRQVQECKLSPGYRCVAWHRMRWTESRDAQVHDAPLL